MFYINMNIYVSTHRYGHGLDIRRKNHLLIFIRGERIVKVFHRLLAKYPSSSIYTTSNLISEVILSLRIFCLVSQSLLIIHLLTSNLLSA